MRRALLLAALLGLAMNAFAAGKILILNSDKPGVGFNDPTPVAPVGGNNGTTLGEQRLNVFNEAARRWQNSINIKVDIEVTATFAPNPDCDASGGAVGSASAVYVHSFEGAPQSNIWYPTALANQIAGRDLNPARSDILAQFNSDVDNATCLGEIDWYYGLDGNHGNDVDLFVVVLHEIGHGLGIAGATGSPEFRENRPAVFHTKMLDLTAGLRWNQMSDEQRRVSTTNTGNLVWDGQNVRERAKMYLTPMTTFTVTQPSAVARNYDIGTASFGPPARTAAMSGKVVLAVDAANAEGPTVNDGCTALTNADQINGNIALIDRGGPVEPPCTFVKKVLNAQAAGATGVIIADNRRDTCLPPPMGGASDAVMIPTISITQDAGSALKAQFASAEVRGQLRVDPSQLAGTSPEGYVRLYAPCVPLAGSSTYHWDTVASPNLLMEPYVSSDLLHGLDLTLYQLLDIGWTLPPRSGRTVLRR